MSKRYDAHSIKRLSRDTLKDVVKLHAAIYNKKLSLRHISKKYNTGYTGAKYFGFIAYNPKMEPIAYYGVIPCFLSYGGKTVLAAQSADTMTHPGYRNMGLFVQLAELTYELCTHEEIPVIFGFPNQNSLPGFIKKLDWKVTDNLDCFIIPIKALPLERMFGDLPVLKRAYNWYIKRILKKYKQPLYGIISDAQSEGFDGVVRDDKYLLYKSYSPTHVLQIDDVEVWIRTNNGLMIGDIAGATTANFKTLMIKLTELARKLGLQQIQFHTSPGTNLHALFKAHYQPGPSFPVIFKDLETAMDNSKMKFTFADIDIF